MVFPKPQACFCDCILVDEISYDDAEKVATMFLERKRSGTLKSMAGRIRKARQKRRAR